MQLMIIRKGLKEISGDSDCLEWEMRNSLAQNFFLNNNHTNGFMMPQRKNTDTSFGAKINLLYLIMFVVLFFIIQTWMMWSTGQDEGADSRKEGKAI